MHESFNSPISDYCLHGQLDTNVVRNVTVRNIGDLLVAIENVNEKCKLISAESFQIALVYS